jgi:hypothetical protein
MVCGTRFCVVELLGVAYQIHHISEKKRDTAASRARAWLLPFTCALAFAAALALALAIVFAFTLGRTGRCLWFRKRFPGFLSQCFVTRREMGEFGLLLDIVHRVMRVPLVMGIWVVFGIFDLVLILRMQLDRVPPAYYLVKWNMVYSRILELRHFRVIYTHEVSSELHSKCLTDIPSTYVFQVRPDN